MVCCTALFHRDCPARARVGRFRVELDGGLVGFDSLAVSFVPVGIVQSVGVCRFRVRLDGGLVGFDSLVQLLFVHVEIASLFQGLLISDRVG